MLMTVVILLATFVQQFGKIVANAGEQGSHLISSRPEACGVSLTRDDPAYGSGVARVARTSRAGYLTSSSKQAFMAGI